MGDPAPSYLKSKIVRFIPIFDLTIPTITRQLLSHKFTQIITLSLRQLRYRSIHAITYSEHRFRFCVETTLIFALDSTHKLLNWGITEEWIWGFHP